MIAAQATVVIPVFNREDLIGLTLESVLAQTVPFFEVIVVDDGSSDRTPSILERFGDQITVVRTSNEGVQHARNIGIARVRTEFVTFLDSDDLIAPEFLSRVLPWMTRHPEIDLLYCNFRTFRDNVFDQDKLAQCSFDFLAGSKVNDGFAYEIPELYRRSLDYQPLFASALLIRRSYIDLHGGFDESFRGVGSEDWEFTLRAICCGKIAMCKDVLSFIRRHSGNDSADAIRANLGEAFILEFSLAQHGAVSQSWENDVRASVLRRRLAALDLIFAKGDFEFFHKIDREISSAQLPVKVRLKRFIAHLPTPFRNLLWRVTQQINR